MTEQKLSEVNINLTRALEVLEDVPREAFAREEDLFRVVELIAKAGGIVEASLASGASLDCSFPPIYSDTDTKERE